MLFMGSIDRRQDQAGASRQEDECGPTLEFYLKRYMPYAIHIKPPHENVVRFSSFSGQILQHGTVRITVFYTSTITHFQESSFSE